VLALCVSKFVVYYGVVVNNVVMGDDHSILILIISLFMFSLLLTLHINTSFPYYSIFFSVIVTFYLLIPNS
jgi:hypothetical protein